MTKPDKKKTNFVARAQLSQPPLFLSLHIIPQLIVVSFNAFQLAILALILSQYIRFNFPSRRHTF